MSKIKDYYERLMYDLDFCEEKYKTDKDDFMAESVWHCHRMAENILGHSIYNIREYNTECLAEWLFIYEFNCNHANIMAASDHTWSDSMCRYLLERFAEYWEECGLDFDEMMNK